MGGAEKRYVEEAFSSNWLSTVGPNLTAFEAEFTRYAGLPAAAVASGTAAIHLGLRLLEVQPGEEVVAPTLTFAGGVNPILYEHARPVFIDSETASWNMDPALLADFLRQRAAVNRLPKAVTVVHLFGQTADMDALLEICRRYELPLLEDAAEALGALYKDQVPGTLGDIGAYSLNGNKIITSTGGGVLVSQRREWVDKARYWATQARDPGLDYLHSEVGYNYRMSNVLAGIARGQLEVLEKRVEQRRAVAFRYRDAFADLPGIALMPQAPWGRHTNWLSCFMVDEARFGMSSRDLITYLDAANVDARPVWKPLHTQKLYASCECVGGQVAENLNRNGLCLPSSSSLSEEEQQFVIDRIREAAGAT
jgi:pyridoxal phosphate-dependent aminotransferase EpsN